MKAERRQELRTNELAQMIDDSREFFRVWGSYLLGGAVVVALIVAFVVYRSKAADEQLTESWNSLQTLSFFDAKGEKKSDEEIKQNFARLEALASEDRGPDFLLEALSTQAQVALRLATSAKDGLETAWLDKAAEAYEAMRQRLPENPLAVAMALSGLASVEADRFVVDGDVNRKDAARGLLEKLRDDPRFSATPFQRAALERINKLDQVFTRVEFAAAPRPAGISPITIDTPTPLVPPGSTPETPPAAPPAPDEAESSPEQPPAEEPPSETIPIPEPLAPPPATEPPTETQPAPGASVAPER